MSIDPETIQTAMSLYSDKLCAVVLLVDTFGKAFDQLPSSSTNTIDGFIDKCERNGCEFQFSSFDQQRENSLKLANVKNENEEARLKVGDFFVTKHSNLSQVHVVFHLALSDVFPENGSLSDKTLKQSELSSRHPVILGIRNVLKVCISNNIQTLTFPLLLTHEMTEEMTISWVMRRAELVLKCVKGFMIEFVQWGPQESRNIQFVVPPVIFILQTSLFKILEI